MDGVVGLVHIREWREGDQLWVWYSATDDMKELREQEIRLIENLKPFRNKTAVPWSKAKKRRGKSGPCRDLDLGNKVLFIA